MRRSPKSALLGALAVVALSGSHAAAYAIGNSGETDSGPTADNASAGNGLETSPGWCTDADVAIDTLTELEPGPGSLERGIAALEGLRGSAPQLSGELDVLIDAYQALADGDLTAIGDADRSAAIDAAAGELTAQLTEQCDVTVGTPVSE